MKVLKTIWDAIRVVAISLTDPEASSVWTWIAILIEGISIIMLSMRVYG